MSLAEALAPFHEPPMTSAALVMPTLMLLWVRQVAYQDLDTCLGLGELDVLLTTTRLHITGHHGVRFAC